MVCLSTAVVEQFAISSCFDKNGLQLGSSKMKMVKFTWGNLLLWCVEYWPYLTAVQCESIFFTVRKKRTDQRASLGDDTLEALLLLKTQPGHPLNSRSQKAEGCLLWGKQLWSWLTDSCFVLCGSMAMICTVGHSLVLLGHSVPLICALENSLIDTGGQLVVWIVDTSA